MFWGIVSLIVISFLIFGFLIDNRTNRYKSLHDQKVKESIEEVKDETQKQNPSNINNIGPW
ncbi:hypothetical protein [Bacillus sp. AK128]